MTIRLASNKSIIETINALGVLVGGLRPYSYLGFAGLFFLSNGNARRVVVFSLLLDLLLSLKMGDESFLYRVGIIFTPALFLSLGFLGDEIRKRTAGLVSARGIRCCEVTSAEFETVNCAREITMSPKGREYSCGIRWLLLLVPNCSPCDIGKFKTISHPCIRIFDSQLFITRKQLSERLHGFARNSDRTT